MLYAVSLKALPSIENVSAVQEQVWFDCQTVYRADHEPTPLLVEEQQHRRRCIAAVKSQAENLCLLKPVNNHKLVLSEEHRQTPTNIRAYL